MHSPKECTGRALTKQKSPVYKVDVGAFKDSDGDTIGDFAGVKSELDYLVETGVGTVYISSFFASPKAATSGFDVLDYRQEDSTLNSSPTTPRPSTSGLRSE